MTTNIAEILKKSQDGSSLMEFRDMFRGIMQEKVESAISEVCFNMNEARKYFALIDKDGKVVANGNDERSLRLDRRSLETKWGELELVQTKKKADVGYPLNEAKKDDAPELENNPFTYYKNPKNKKEAQSNVNFWHYVGMADNDEIEAMGKIPASYKSYAKSMKQDAQRELKKLTEELDPVDKKATKKDFDDREDKDLDNDGDTDDSDEYLHKRRKAISKEIDEAVNYKKMYLDNEDDNLHTENILMLAKLFGTAQELKKVQEIMKTHEKKGHLSSADNDWMYKNIHKKYYPHFAKKYVKESVDLQEAKLSDADYKKIAAAIVLDGKSYEDMADKHGVPVATLKKNMQRVMQRTFG